MQRGKKILLVDDDPRNVYALRLTLVSRGFDCITTQDATEGLALAQKNAENLGLILMDMMMPGIDGYEAIGILKNTEATAGLPVIAVTAQAMTGDRDKCLQAGADDYLAKPIDVDQLMDIISRHFK